MNGDTLGAVAELAGAGGVILTLVYLARRLKENTSSFRSSAGLSTAAQLTASRECSQTVFTLSVLIAIHLAIAGCTAKKESVPWEQIKDGKGVLILSATAAKKCWFWQVDLSLYPSSWRSGWFVDKAGSFFQVTSPLIGSDFVEVHGQLQAIPLDAGVYTFVPVGTFLRSLPYKVRRVRIYASEIVYAGEIHIDGCFRPTISIRDSWDRDKSRTRAMYPNLPLQDVQQRLFW